MFMADFSLKTGLEQQDKADSWLCAYFFPVVICEYCTF